ncbi:SGNH/GDSL hydrolase family protein [Nocardia aobensis]|uniref:SGNH/GDSL hydrolase family protein n=1 Tax=Nocardia aobensis TaxID=257277 RepID=A0ABW6P9E7_9NOCA
MTGNWFVRGAGLADFIRGGRGHEPRLPDADRSRLPADTWNAAQVPAGLHLELMSHADAVVLVVDTESRHPLASPTAGDRLTVWRGDRCVGVVDVPESGGPVTVPLERDGAVYTIYLPEARLGRVSALVPVGGRIEAIPPRPRWLAYGDSITQGWSVSDPALAYPAIVARRHGLEAWNLGFAGAARGEIAAAQYLATVEAEVISLAFGTNNWSVLPTGAGHMAALVRDFVTAVRAGHPRTPLLILSPIVRPEAEQSRNAVGATLAELRDAVEAAARQLHESAGPIRLVPGRDLVGPVDLVDGIHPGDAGHHAIAAAVGPVLAELLGTNPVHTREGVTG